MSATIISLEGRQRRSRCVSCEDSAMVIILPVIRIERYQETPPQLAIEQELTARYARAKERQMANE